MQQPGLEQDQKIHKQWIRVVPKKQNGRAGGALFGLMSCSFDAQSYPPASTKNPRLDRLVHGPDRDTEIYTADVTTSLFTVSV